MNDWIIRFTDRDLKFWQFEESGKYGVLAGNKLPIVIKYW